MDQTRNQEDIAAALSLEQRRSTEHQAVQLPFVRGLSKPPTALYLTRK
jgi:hypothetical protein